MFHITRGYKAYGSPTSNGPTLVEKDVWREIKDCFNLDLRIRETSRAARRRPCPWAVNALTARRRWTEPARQKALTAAADIGSWEKNENSWYYDKSSGYLYPHLLQKVDNGNPKGPLSSPSPTGGCDPAKGSLPAECPNASKIPENYYFCPAGGCIAYGVKLDANEVPEPYVPGQSTCQTLSASPPSDVNLLIDRGTETVLVRDPQVAKQAEAREAGGHLPHDALKKWRRTQRCARTRGRRCNHPGVLYPNLRAETQLSR